jgi:hypothetical protein
MSQYIPFAFQSVTAQSDKPKYNRELPKWQTKYTVIAVILCKIGRSDSGAAAEQNHVFWGAMPCHWVSSSNNVEGSECLLVPVDECSTISQNGRHCSTAHPITECHTEATRIFNNTARESHISQSQVCSVCTNVLDCH